MNADSVEGFCAPSARVFYKAFCSICNQEFTSDSEIAVIKKAAECQMKGTPMIHSFDEGDEILRDGFGLDGLFGSCVRSVIEQLFFAQGTHEPYYVIGGRYVPAKDVKKIISGATPIKNQEKQ